MYGVCLFWIVFLHIRRHQQPHPHTFAKYPCRRKKSPLGQKVTWSQHPWRDTVRWRLRATLSSHSWCCQCLPFELLLLDCNIKFAAPTAPNVPPPAASELLVAPAPPCDSPWLLNTRSMTRCSLLCGHMSTTYWPTRKCSFRRSFSVFCFTSLRLSSISR